MISKREKGFYISMVIVLALLLAFTIFSVVISVIVISKNDTFLNNIFELFYMVVHFAITFYAMMLAVRAIKKGSWVMRNLMYTRENNIVKSRPANIIAMLVMIFNLLVFTYSVLMVFNVVPALSSFPLKMILINVSITVFTVALYFYLYPYVMDYQKGDK